MLRVVALKGGRADYYLGLASVSYYTERAAEPAGLWYGQGAKAFGLSGIVERDALSNLCDGYSVDGSEALVRNAGRTEGRAPRKFGEDLTFNVPKSVSVAWALAPEDLRKAIQTAVLRAVRDTLDYLQENLACARVGAGGQELVQGVPLTFALFVHGSSRAGDCHYHVHVVCPNVTTHRDARTTAIDSTVFHHHEMTLGALFRAALAERLATLGFPVARDRWAFKIPEIPQDLCDHLSKRRAEIEQGLVDAYQGLDHVPELFDRAAILQATTGKMAQIQALETRGKRDERPWVERLAEWQDIGRERGIEPDHIRALLQPAPPLQPDQRARAREAAYQEAVAELAETHAHWSKRDLTQQLAITAVAHGLGIRDVAETIAQKLGGPELIPLGEVVTTRRNAARKAYREQTEARFTTPEIRRMEARMLAEVEQLRSVANPARENVVEGVIASKPGGRELDAEQAEAVRHLTQGPNIACMTGEPGTGKSATLHAARLVWELDGKTVLGCAVAGRAAKGLQQATGIDSDTLKMTLIRLDKGWLTLTKDHVLVLDEAGMGTTRELAQLTRHVARAGAKLVLVGDANQLQPIGAGGPFKSIAERIGEARLVKNWRIREQWTWRLEPQRDFGRGEADRALETYAKHGHLHVEKTKIDALLAMVERWKSDEGVQKPAATLLLAGQNVDVRALNRLCQRERYLAGALGQTPLKAGGNLYFPNDVVLFAKRDKALGIDNGDRGTIVDIDQAQECLTVRCEGDGRVVKLDLRAYGTDQLRLGYSATVHKAQGETLERCHALIDGGALTDRHLSLVMASRARSSTHLFTDVETAGPRLQNLIRSMSRERQKDLATDILERAHGEPPLPRLDDDSLQVRQPSPGISLGP